MADFFVAIGVLLLVSILFILPGVLFWRLLRSSNKVDFTYLASPALGVASLVFLFSATASLYRYSFLLMFAENLLLIVVLLLLLKAYRKLSFKIDWKVLRKGFLWMFFLFSFLLFFLPSLVLVVPLDTDAEGFGFYALTVREGGTIDSLAPYMSDVKYLYSPGYFISTAYLSDLLGKAPIHNVMLAFSHLTAFLFLFSVFYLGNKLMDRRFAFLMTLFCVVGIGLFTSVLDSHYTTVLALLMVPVFLGLFFEVLRSSSLRSSLLAGLLLGAVCLSHPDTLIILLIALVPFYILVFFSKEKIRMKAYLYSFFLAPAVGIGFSLPWLLSSFSLFFSSDIVNSEILLLFGTSLSNWVLFVVFQGVFVVLLAAAGCFYSVKRRRFEDVFMLWWVVALIEFGLVGLVEKLGRSIGFDITHHFYPPNIAWAGPIIPFAFLSAVFVLNWPSRLVAFFRRLAKPILVIGIFAVLLAVLFSPAIIHFSKGLPIRIFGGFSTEADVDAMLWLKHNSPKDAVLMNYPDLEGHWVPVIAERKALANRIQPFFVGAGNHVDTQLRLGDSLAKGDFGDVIDIIQGANVSFVVVPQLSYNASAYATSQTWREPKLFNMTALMDSSSSFRRIYNNNGAMVYEVIH